MSSEVICLSSDEDVNTSIKNPYKTHEVEKNAQKRKLPSFQISSNGDAKKLKVEKKVSPQKKGSQDVPQVFSSGDATKQEVEKLGCPRPEPSNDLPQVPSNGSDTKQKVKKMDQLAKPGCSTDFDNTKESRKVVKPQLVAKTKIPIPLANEDVFRNFLEMCSKKKDDADTREILQKLEKSYDKLSSAQKDNSEFRLYISDCHNKVAKGLSSGIYKPILDLHNEIKKVLQINSVEKAVDNTGKTDEQEVLISKKDEKKIKLLEDAIKKCKEKIQELEDADIDLNDDDENSAYIMEDKYKKKLILLCNQLSKLTGDKAMRKQILKTKIKVKDIRDEMTGNKLLDEEILNFINSNVNEINLLKYLENESYAAHIKVPEYLDVLKCIQKCNADNKLGINEMELKMKAKKAFETVVKFLKKKRLDDTELFMQSFIEGESEDPALKDEKLNKKLCKSTQEGKKRIEEFLKKYADKQESLKQENLDVEKQAEASSEDDAESDTENENLDENLSLEEKCNEIGDKKNPDSNLDEKSLIDNDVGKTKTETQSHSKNVGETVEVIPNEDSDIIVIASDDNDSIDKKKMQNKRTTKKVPTGQLAVVKTKMECDEIMQVDSDSDVI